MSKTIVVCENLLCGKSFEKENKEINRSKILGRKQYCCRKCFANAEGKKNLLLVDEETKIRLQNNIKNYVKKGSKDQYSNFRFFMKVMKNKNRAKKWFNDFDVKYLKEIWDKQNGKCPFTGWNMILPKNVSGHRARNIRNASVDRIDSSKGYLKGNIQFVCFTANIAKNNYSEEELIEFCEAVAKHRPSQLWSH